MKFSQTFQNRLASQLVVTVPALENINSLNLIMPTQQSYETKIEGFPVHIKNWSQMG